MENRAADGGRAGGTGATGPGHGWQSIQADVLARIRAREWPPGGLIPREAELATGYGCARATVNRALRELAAAGILDRKRKAGTRVALHPVRKAVQEIPVTRLEIEAQGMRYGYRLLSREQVAMPVEPGASASVAPATAISADTTTRSPATPVTGNRESLTATPATPATTTASTRNPATPATRDPAHVGFDAAGPAAARDPGPPANAGAFFAARDPVTPANAEADPATAADALVPVIPATVTPVTTNVSSAGPHLVTLSNAGADPAATAAARDPFTPSNAGADPAAVAGANPAADATTPSNTGADPTNAEADPNPATRDPATRDPATSPDPAAPFLRLTALHLADDRPYLFEDRLISPDTVPMALSADFAAISANEWLVHNAAFSHAELVFAAVPASAAEARALGCAEGTALLREERVTWDGARMVTRVRLAYAPGHRLRSAIYSGLPSIRSD